MIRRAPHLPSLRALAAVTLSCVACADQPLGLARDLELTLPGVALDSLSGAPADTLSLVFQLSDHDGAPVSGATVRTTIQGEGAEVASSDPVSDPNGRIAVRWVLGVRAIEPQRLEVEARSGGRRQRLALTATVAPREVARLTAPDSLAMRLNSPSTVIVVATDPYGNVFVPDSLEYVSTDTAIVVVDPHGVIRGRSRGIAPVIVLRGAHADTTTVHVFQVAGTIEVGDSVALHSLGQVSVIRYRILSDSGKEIRDTIPAFSLSDTTVARLVGAPTDSSATVQSRANGTTTLTIAVGQVTQDIAVQVSQRSVSLHLTPSTLPVFDALGDSIRVTVSAFDSLGTAVDSPKVSFAVADSAIGSVTSTGWVRSIGNGSTIVAVEEVTGGAASLAVSVSQAADSLEVFWNDTATIKSAAALSPPPLTCLARDRNGYPLSASPSVTSRTGTVLGTNCATLTTRATGFDTLIFTSGSKTTVLPHVLAVRPLVSAPTGAPVVLDSFPYDFRLWAPSGRVNSQGNVEIYVTGYQFVPDSNGVGPGALHRLVSSDGVSFRYDGIALDRPVPCELICSGIENIAVIPRNDGPGWRMYFAAGSSGTYGWQLFSAVSVDERHWTMEPGIRISNGGPIPPAEPGVIPWPVGEGLVVDQLPGGEWRMIVGGYQRIPNPPNRFEIVEYRSTDQLTWTYVGAILTTAEAPATARRSVYSPGIVELRPGIWRMFFSGDDNDLPGGRSRIFSAVSLDRTHWRTEGELVGAPGIDFFYSVLVQDRLYFLRQAGSELRHLAVVTLTMP